MTQACTLPELQAQAPNPEQALEAALGIWALIETAESLPASTETRESLGRARHVLDQHLQRLGWDEEFLREQLAEDSSHGEPPSFSPFPDVHG